jgi:hypothetical protein
VWDRLESTSGKGEGQVVRGVLQNQAWASVMGAGSEARRAGRERWRGLAKVHESWTGDGDGCGGRGVNMSGGRSRRRVGLVRELAVREVLDDWGAHLCGWLGSAGRGSWREWPLAAAWASGSASSESASAASAGGEVEFLTATVKDRV